MFYAHFVLSKKGPLARIWLAAHWDKKLTKAHVFETNIESSVEGILQPKVKMALRTSGHLLLGVVRIYSRKAKYLLADCNEAFIKIKMAFRPGVVDLPEENREAALNAITLPEVFHDFDTAMPDLTEIDVQAQFTLNQSRAEEITMREDYGHVTLVGDDGFGDMGFEDNEIVREASSAADAPASASLLFGGGADRKAAMSAAADSTHSALDMDIDAPLRDDGFGGGVGEGLLSAETGGLFEPGGLFDDAPMEHVPIDGGGALAAKLQNAKKLSAPPPPGGAKSDSDDDDDYYGDMGPASVGGGSSGPSSPEAASPANGAAAKQADGEKQLAPTTAAAAQTAGGAADQTTLIQNEDETFALAPLEASGAAGGGGNFGAGADRAVGGHGGGGGAKGKRKRKLIIDEVKNISGEEMKSQLADTSDIVTTLDLAPPTKRLMHWKETGGVEKLFALPGRAIQSRVLSKHYQRHLTTRAKENEDIGLCAAAADDHIDLEGGAAAGVDAAAATTAPPEALPPEDEAARTSRKRKLSELEAPPHLEQQQPEEDQQLAAPEDVPPLPLPVEQQQLDASLPVANLHDESATQPNNEQQLPVTSPPPQQQQQPEVVVAGDSDDNILSMPTQPYQPPPPAPQSSGPEVQPPPPEMAAQQQQPEIDVDDFFAQPLAVASTSAAVKLNHVAAADHHQVAQQSSTFLSAPLDDDDDMECPPSVGPPEEQGADETYEQFEERVLNKRAQHMLHVIQRQFQRQSSIRFSDLSRNNTRKQVAQKFYTFLVLKKQQAVELHQDEPFGELLITRGPKLEPAY